MSTNSIQSATQSTNTTHSTNSIPSSPFILSFPPSYPHLQPIEVTYSQETNLYHFQDLFPPCSPESFKIFTNNLGCTIQTIQTNFQIIETINNTELSNHTIQTATLTEAKIKAQLKRVNKITSTLQILKENQLLAVKKGSNWITL